MSGLGFLQTHHPETRKPAFRWLGWRGPPLTSSSCNESRKRQFGTEITNYDSKRSRLDSGKPNGKVQKEMVIVKQEDSENSCDKSDVEQHMKQESRSYMFGPFAPGSVNQGPGSENKTVRRTKDWESLASTHRPNYRNQGIDVY